MLPVLDLERNFSDLLDVLDFRVLEDVAPILFQLAAFLALVLALV